MFPGVLVWSHQVYPWLIVPEGDYAAWTYFQSVATPENADFVRRFQTKYPRQSITDPMETAYIGVKLWAGAVNQAQSLDPKSIRRALLNQRLKGPGGEVRIDPDTQHCFRTPRIGRIQADGQFKVVWKTPGPVKAQPWSPYIPENKGKKDEPVSVAAK